MLFHASAIVKNTKGSKIIQVCRRKVRLGVTRWLSILVVRVFSERSLSHHHVRSTCMIPEYRIKCPVGKSYQSFSLLLIDLRHNLRYQLIFVFNDSGIRMSLTLLKERLGPPCPFISGSVRARR